MNVEQLSFFQRFRVIFHLIVSLLFHRTPFVRTSTRSPAPPGVAPLPIPTGPPPVLRDLVDVISIAQTKTATGINVTLFSLESYRQGFTVLGRHSTKYGELSRENIWHALPVFAATDDLGNEYRWWPSGGDRSRFSCLFAPALDERARELTLTITQFRWIFHNEQRHQVDEGPWTFTIPVA